MSWLTTEAGIIGDAISGKITWAEAKTRTDALGAKIVSVLAHVLGPEATAVATTAVSTIKTDVNTAITFADSALAPELGAATRTAEGLIDGLIMAGLGSVGAGAAAPIANKITNDAIDGFVSILAAAMHARAMQIKASLTPARPGG